MIKEKVIEFLDSAEINYKAVSHKPVSSIQECKEIEELVGCGIYKNLFLRTTNGSQRFLLMIDEDKPFRTGDVSKKLGSSRLSFASAEEMEDILSTSPGSLSFLSLLFDKEHTVKLAVDSDLLTREYLGCHPCDNTMTIVLSSEEIVKRVFPAMNIEPIIISI